MALTPDGRAIETRPSDARSAAVACCIRQIARISLGTVRVEATHPRGESRACERGNCSGLIAPGSARSGIGAFMVLPPAGRTLPHHWPLRDDASRWNFQ